jgi:hypothetical protein
MSIEVSYSGSGVVVYVICLVSRQGLMGRLACFEKEMRRMKWGEYV